MNKDIHFKISRVTRLVSLSFLASGAEDRDTIPPQYIISIGLEGPLSCFITFNLQSLFPIPLLQRQQFYCLQNVSWYCMFYHKICILFCMRMHMKYINIYVVLYIF